MDTEQIVGELRRSKRNACDAARYSAIIPAILNEENIAPMNALINRLSEKRLGFVRIVTNLSWLIRQYEAFAALWNVEQRDPKPQIGHYLRKSSANVGNVEKSFIVNCLTLKLVVASFVLSNVGLILKNLITALNRVFMVRVYGYRQERELLNETTQLVRNVGSGEVISMFIIRNLKEMVELKEMKTLLPYVRIATG